ncbi:MAG: NAD(P)H-dependent glycerol-3-phosphate dehydrogenase [Actinomycetota bacterium]
MGTMPSVAVIGGGSWGTALAKVLAAKGASTTLWAREPDVVAAIESDRINQVFLPAIELPTAIRPTTDLEAAVDGAEIVVSAVPTQHIRTVFTDLATHLSDADVVVSVSKGIETTTLRTPTQILSEFLPERLAARIVVLSGPSFAREVAVDHPAAVVAAGSSLALARDVRDLFTTAAFRVYSSDDARSAEIGGALKNVIAIGAGMSAGLGFADNALAALITRGLAEISRLGVAVGGDAHTFAGLSGMGDLVLTCHGSLSRNRTVGVELGLGRTLDEVVDQMEMVAEGVKTTVAVRRLASELGVSMPITEAVHATLYEDLAPTDAVTLLMGRAPRDERDH